GDFMMANFDLISERRQYLDDLRPKIHQSVRGHDGKVAALVSDLVYQVWVFLLARVPSSLDRIQTIERMLWCGRIADLIEHEKLGLGSKIRGIGESGLSQVRFSLA